MKLIVGLGNDGAPYDGTRHNVGWDVVRAVAARHKTVWKTHTASRRRVARSGDWRAGHETVRLLLPLTLMNASGDAVALAPRWGIEPHEVLLLCDDVNLPLGQLRLRAGGSDGGHHGLASCLAALGTDAVPRLRIGVGRERLPNELTNFVLSRFDADERPLIAAAMTRAVEACEAWVERGIETAMNRVNARMAS